MNPFAKNPKATSPKQIQNEKLNTQVIRTEIESVIIKKIAEYFKETLGIFMYNSLLLLVQ
jgi:hypothetical protein